MKANRLSWLLLFLLVSAVFQLPAQQSEADRKLLADLRDKAEKGDAQSQVQLGEAFRLGSLGQMTDYVEAVKWYRKAAEQGNAMAQGTLGSCYANGRGVAKDEVEAANQASRTAWRTGRIWRWIGLGLRHLMTCSFTHGKHCRMAPLSQPK